MRRVRASDSGLTLTELLLSIVILGIIIGPVTSSIILVIKSTTSASNRLDTSHDQQIVDVYFPSDVAGSAKSTSSNNGVDTYFAAVSTAAPPTACTYTPSGYYQGLVTLHWRDTDPVSPSGQSDKYAWYYVSRSAAGVAPGTLHRAFCAISTAAVPARVGTVSDYVLARDLASTNPSVLCDSGACPAPLFGAGSVPPAPAPPIAITLSATLVSGDSSTAVNVQGVRRVS